MRLIDIADLAGPVAWTGPVFPIVEGAVVKLRWIDRAYRWHVNKESEFFLVLDGRVDMHVRRDASIECIELGPGMAMLIEAGEAHVAHPRVASRILVVERD